MAKYEFEYSTCEKEGVDSQGVLNFIKRIKEKGILLHSFTMARNGKIIAEINAYPYENTYRHVMNSVTKTFTSIAVGIVYDRGLISLDDKIHKFFNNPSYKKNGLENATIRHLLTMTLGQEGPDMFASSEPELDWCERMFDRPVNIPPGTQFFYNSMATHLLSGIVTKVSGQNVSSLLKENFFDPCGIDDYYWIEDPSGNSTGGVGIYIPNKELLKLGQLLLNKGVLNGHRVVSEEWCEMATAKQVETLPAYTPNKTESIQGYGFQMWRCTHNGFRASGLFGQLCVCIPNKNVTFAVNASTAGSQPLLDTFFETIFDCIKDEPLEEKPENYEKIKELSHLLDTHPVSANGSSHYEQIISGKELKYRDKEGGITLEFKPEGCTFTISDKGKSFSCILGHNEFKHEPTDFDQYFMPISSAQDYACPRPIELKPETYGSYTWIGVSHLKIMVMFKDHTSYNYWDIYFDDKRARVDETFTYLVEGYDYHTKNVLMMV